MSEVKHLKPRRLRQLEDRISACLDSIDDNWRKIAKDLAEIRDKKMHHDAGYDDWYKYVDETWPQRISRNQIQHLVGAHDVVQSISRGIKDLDEDHQGSATKVLKSKEISPGVLQGLRSERLDDTARAEIFSAAVRHAHSRDRAPTQRDVKTFVNDHFPDRASLQQRMKLRRAVEAICELKDEMGPAKFVKALRAGNGDKVTERILRNKLPKALKYMSQIRDRLE